MKSDIVKLLKKMGIIVALALIIEVFVFNYRFFESYTFDNILETEMVISDGITDIGDGIYQINDADNAYFELTGFKVDVKNVYVSMVQTYYVGASELEATTGAEAESLPPSESYMDAGGFSVMNIRLSVTDDGHYNTHPMPDTEIVNGIASSSYIRIYTDGACDSIRIYPLLDNYEFIHVNGISLNSRVPFNFSLKRFALIILIVSLVLLFKSSSKLYLESFNFNNKKHVALTFAVLFINIAVILFAALSADLSDKWQSVGEHEKQYEELARDITAGHLNIEQQPPEFLMEMANPYDYIERTVQSIVRDESLLIDVAYYNNQYYVYFGITPELLFFLPVMILTGKTLPTWIAVCFCSIVYVLLVFRLISVLIEKYYKNTSVGVYLLLSTAMSLGTCAVYLASFGTTYSMPAICGMMLSLGGLILWLKAREEDGLSKLYLLVGAVLIALTIGCRPQYSFMVFLAFPIFWKEIRDGEFFRPRKDSVLNTLCVIAPFLVYGCFILYYNYIRFDNPFEFGVSYLLTVNDMTHFNSAPAKLFEGVFLQLLQPAHIVYSYPFMQVVDSEFTLQADQYMEPMLGGLFALSPILVMSFGILKAFGMFKNTGAESSGLAVTDKENAFTINMVGLVAFFAGIFILVLDSVSAGTSQRYQADFAIYLMIPALIVLLSLAEKFRENSMYRFFVGVLLTLVVFTVFGNMLTIIADGKYFAMDDMNPETYYYIKYTFFRI